MKSFADYMGEPHDQRAPFKFGLNTKSSEAWDIGVGATPATNALSVFLPDEIDYVVDDIYVYAQDEDIAAGGGNIGTLAFGLIAANGIKGTGTGLSDNDYFVAAFTPAATTLPDASNTGYLSVSNGDFDWAATADTEAERTVKGPAWVTITTTAGTVAATGIVSMGARFHAASSDKYPMMDESDHGNSQP